MTGVTDVDAGSLVPLLDDIRRELSDVVDELDRTRVAHRRVESLLLAVLDHVPVPVVVVDQELQVRAVSAAAEQAWAATLARPMSEAGPLDDQRVTEVCRTALATGHVTPDAVPEGFGAAVLEEPGTAARYVVVWAGPAMRVGMRGS